MNARDWELHVSFAIHGSTGDLFGDGAAIWYVQDPSQSGLVFGSKDYFRGLGVFLDTYSNHNGPHAVSFCSLYKNIEIQTFSTGSVFIGQNLVV